MRSIVVFLAGALALASNIAFSDIVVTSWNIEHLGTDGRGFGGGYGGGTLPRRTDAQLDDIADFIQNELESDVLALQEIGISESDDGVSSSDELDKITARLGSSREYYLPPQKANHSEKSMYVGYLWNSDRVRPRVFIPMDLPDVYMAGKALFDRQPVIGAFDVIDNGQRKNDFLLVNVHLASGQHNDENHAIAIIAIEHRLNSSLKIAGIKESDRIILGDFNDNPYKVNSSGKAQTSPAMIAHMEFKGYENFVRDGTISTRMDNNLRSTIDHVLVNSSADRHIDETSVEIWRPASTSQFASWRRTYSDHFPLSVKINIGSDDDAD